MHSIVARHNPIIISTPTSALLDRFTRFYNTSNNYSNNFAMLYFMGFVHELWMRDRYVAISLYNSEGVNVIIIADTEIFFFIMHSSFLNISSQRGPLCPIYCIC